jgi:hypothetical protein
MKKLRDFTLGHIVHPLKRQIIERESQELIRKMLQS